MLFYFSTLKLFVRELYSTTNNIGIMKFNNPNFHQLADNGPNFKNSHWRSQLLTFCKTLDPC
ncbi:hypothetical protein Hanom_Chr04g00362241 [Helianthus anomalus]